MNGPDRQHGLPHQEHGGAAAGVRVDALLDGARAGLDRLSAAEAARAQHEGALLVDTRYAAQRERDGTIPGALLVERNELEWRLDPTCPYRSPQATGPDLHVVVVCNEGYSSSLAARSLRALGLHRATDLAGGFQAWRAAGLPVTPPGAPPGTPVEAAAAEAAAHGAPHAGPDGAPGAGPHGAAR